MISETRAKFRPDLFNQDVKELQGKSRETIHRELTCLKQPMQILHLVERVVFKTLLSKELYALSKAWTHWVKLSVKITTTSDYKITIIGQARANKDLSMRAMLVSTSQIVPILSSDKAWLRKGVKVVYRQQSHIIASHLWQKLCRRHNRSPGKFRW